MLEFRKKTCNKCQSTFTYTLADLTLVCRSCGHRQKSDTGEPIEKKEKVEPEEDLDLDG